MRGRLMLPMVAASRPARQAGIRSGTTLAQARGILPSLIARGRDVSCETSAHEGLVETATELSPKIEDAAPDVVFADVGGMERLFEGDSCEHDIGQAAIVAAAALDLPVRVGIAGNKLAARIAARMPDSPKVVAAGTDWVRSGSTMATSATIAAIRGASELSSFFAGSSTHLVPKRSVQTTNASCAQTLILVRFFTEIISVRSSTPSSASHS